MINPRFCKMCEHGIINWAEWNKETGEKISDFFVVCQGDAHLINSDVPKECPFILEHTVTMQYYQPEPLEDAIWNG